MPQIEARLRAINALAPIHRAVRADVALDKILRRGGFELERIVALEPDFLDPTGHAHEHAAGIRSVSLVLPPRPFDGGRCAPGSKRSSPSAARTFSRGKGILDVAGEARRLVFQSVHMLQECEFQRPWRTDERRASRLVLIGRNLDEAALQAAFASRAAGALSPVAEPPVCCGWGDAARGFCPVNWR